MAFRRKTAWFQKSHLESQHEKKMQEQRLWIQSHLEKPGVFFKHRWRIQCSKNAAALTEVPTQHWNCFDSRHGARRYLWGGSGRSQTPKTKDQNVIWWDPSTSQATNLSCISSMFWWIAGLTAMLVEQHGPHECRSHASSDTLWTHARRNGLAKVPQFMARHNSVPRRGCPSAMRSCRWKLWNCAHLTIFKLVW